jgi:hypothetical protein
MIVIRSIPSPALFATVAIIGWETDCCVKGARMRIIMSRPRLSTSNCDRRMHPKSIQVKQYPACGAVHSSIVPQPHIAPLFHPPPRGNAQHSTWNADHVSHRSSSRTPLPLLLHPLLPLLQLPTINIVTTMPSTFFHS